MHEIVFPQYVEDIKTRKRTLFHWRAEGIRVGDGLRILSRPNFPCAYTSVITKVDHVKLRDLTAEDLVKLNVADAATYLARWDAAYPDTPSSDDPMVYRIEFQYNPSPEEVPPSPEWSLAG
jgi:hypothetical protein